MAEYPIIRPFQNNQADITVLSATLDDITGLSQQ
jgi:hypothetical protein